MFWRTLTVALWCLFSSATLLAATLADLEQEVRTAVAARKQAGDERSRLIAAAATLAATINTAERASGSVRAGSGLERSLRDFDRLARRLDAVDRSLHALDGEVARLRRAFDEEFERQSRQLPQDRSASAYARAAELDNARRRVDELSAPPPAFRRLLVVQPSSADTVTDLDRKIAILVSEQTRGDDALTAARNNLSVLDARIVITRRQLDELTTNAQGVPQDLRLVQRQVDDVRARLRDIEAARDETLRVQTTIEQDLAVVQQQITQCRQHRSELVSPR